MATIASKWFERGPQRRGGTAAEDPRDTMRSAPARRTHRDPRRLQVGARRLAPNARRLLYASQRPAKASKRQDLLLFLFVQDVAHLGLGDHGPAALVNVLRVLRLAGFQALTTGRFWPLTEAPGGPWGSV